MNADTDVNLFGLLLLGVVRSQLGVNRLRALHGMNDGGKLDEKGVTNGFNDMAMIHTHSLLDEPIMDVQQPHRARFVGAHLAAEANDVGEHDRRQPPLLSVDCLARLVVHRCGLFGWYCLAVNRFLLAPTAVSLAKAATPHNRIGSLLGVRASRPPRKEDVLMDFVVLHPGYKTNALD